MSSSHVKARKTSEVTPSDIVKSGHLYIKRPPATLKIRLKTWQKRLLVLRDELHTHDVRLEVYSTDQWFTKKTDFFVIKLRDVAAIEEYSESKTYPHAFTLARKDQSPLVLGVETEGEMREWLVVLKLLAGKSKDQHRCSLPVDLGSHLRRHSVDTVCQTDSKGPKTDIMSPQSDIFEIFCSNRDRSDRGRMVQIQPTDSSRRNKLEGTYLMRVNNGKISLRGVNSTDDVISWPILDILKFKSEALEGGHVGEIITLEAGLSCDEAQGTFIFKTKSGKDLIDSVKSAVRKVSGQCNNPDVELEKLRPPKLMLGKCESVPNMSFASKPDTSHGDMEVRGTEAVPYLEVIPDDETADSTLSNVTVPVPVPKSYSALELNKTAEEVAGSQNHKNNQPVDPSREGHRKESEISNTSDKLPVQRCTSECAATPPLPPPRPRHTLSAGQAGSTRPLPPLPTKAP